MAKTNMINRDIKRRALATKYRVRRDELRAKVRSLKTSDEGRHEAMVALQKLPRDSSRSRERNRCGLTGRSRGFYRKFGLSRMKLRELIMKGVVPGVLKASW
ncbi:MAG: 30S ribosomal protein S14 [Pseudomonadota bacterium]